MAFALIYNLQLTNPRITCAGLEGKEIINAALGHVHAVRLGDQSQHCETCAHKCRAGEGLALKTCSRAGQLLSTSANTRGVFEL